MMTHPSYVRDPVPASMIQTFGDAPFSTPSQVEELTLSPKERKAYVDFERAVQSDYVGIRHKLQYERGSHTMEVLTLLSKFRQVMFLPRKFASLLLGAPTKMENYEFVRTE